MIARLLRLRSFTSHEWIQHRPGWFFAECGQTSAEARSALQPTGEAAPSCKRCAAMKEEAAPESGERRVPPAPVMPKLKTKVICRAPSARRAA